MDPSDPGILYAASYDRPGAGTYNEGLGGNGSGIYKTINGGDSWEKLTNGLPESGMGRIGLDHISQRFGYSLCGDPYS